MALRIPRLPRLRLRNPVLPRLRYAPHPDGLADPGEVVWTWVAYEDDPSQGKDRPVLVIGTEGDQLLALQLTSRDHDVDAAQERRDGREWMDIGTGAWDARRRPSEVRLNRLLRLDPAAVRREGAALDRDRFDAVLAAAQPYLRDAPGS
jgi:PemK-like, MazF-like toxin of type II toxin-antitoxin system